MNVTEKAALHPCVAHRGWSGAAPENTMAAFRLALSEPAVEWIELDVHLSKDEIPVVIHDASLKRTTGVKARVRDKTAAELAALDAGGWFHRMYAGEGIPTLSQVLELTRGRCRLNIELKDGEPDRDLLARKVGELLQSQGREADSILTSFDHALLLAARRHAPRTRTGLILDKRPSNIAAVLDSLGATILSINYKYVNVALLAQTEAAGIDVMAWTVNEQRELNKLAVYSQSFQLCTNYPDRWLAAVR
ncbi:glycerophosphodiester phosphodiesterase [Cohnella rhizosphaerae]|uniref:Glycerophosphodiester phosphodiesterase family protein n=1 Tax=Cohnella rhizosphaerae TaxID=1457232 RepID=A0A9X4QW08_9BACL|nr:glycerophosphodiester phosphodiesterase family protein [Cohnella rhizosphaerae]MDG0812022.1 glycerophosphodiester phosphodiesterase family protein [Cohnella rhizosphaerae]